MYVKIANEPGVVVRTFNPSRWGAEGGGWISDFQHSLGQLEFFLTPILGKETSPATVEINMEASQTPAKVYLKIQQSHCWVFIRALQGNTSRTLSCYNQPGSHPGGEWIKKMVYVRKGFLSAIKENQNWRLSY